MPATIVDGRAIAAELRAALAARVAAGGMRSPGLAVVLVGEHPASLTYVGAKQQAAEEAGFITRDIRLSATVSTDDVVAVVAGLNADPAIDGILVQLPLPEGIDAEAVMDGIDPAKDVDGFHPLNLGLLMSGRPRVYPCTPSGVMRILEHHSVETAGKTAVVVGRSLIVGRPLAMMLSRRGVDATVTLCHSRTPDLAGITSRADIVIAAAGMPELLRRDMIREGAVVIDVGINRVADSSRKRGYRLVGDVAFEELRDKAALLTPVPGGVGPLTIAMLLENTVDARDRRLGRPA